MQDPPEICSEFIKRWEDGDKVVLATKPVSATNKIMHFFRKKYYQILDKIAEVEIVKDTTGFGLYDKCVIDSIRAVNDPYPYLRGLVCELGFKTSTITFEQPRRVRGISKNNFYTLFDIAMLGLISHSLVPIRLASFIGLFLGILSVLIGIVFLVLKLLNWDLYPVGIAPALILMCFMFGAILFFIGLLGEYIGSIHSYLQNRPIVVEEKRINF